MARTTLGLALRPELHTPRQIIEYSKTAEETGAFSHVFIPDVPGGLESLEISAAALSRTSDIRIGSGVIRLLEHDNRLLQRRLETIQALSGNRLILGIGAGSPGTKPGDTVTRFIGQLDELKSAFGSATRSSGIQMPETYIATLKNGIARRSIGHSSGLLLNFCSPAYAKRLLESLGDTSFQKTTFACYLKVFYSMEKKTADRLLIQEFVNYDSIKQYHEMFERDAISGEISSARKALESGEPATIPGSLRQISLSNPDSEGLRAYVEEFKKAGIDLPVIYPYFVRGEDHLYKQSIIEKIAEVF